MTNENEKITEGIISTIKAFDNNVSQIEELLKNGYPEVSIILIVSAFESFLGDIFELCSDNWFDHIKDYAQRRRHIYDYLNKINIFDEFIKKRYLYLDYDTSGFGTNEYIADEKSLFDILLGKRFDEPFEKGKGKINFQNLKNDYGAKNAYKTFFNIDLPKSLAKDYTSNELWEKLKELFDERHAIVHKGKKTTFSEEYIVEVFGSIKFLKKHLCVELISRTLKRHEFSYEC